MSGCPDYDLTPNIEIIHNTMLCSIQMLCSLCAILANTCKYFLLFSLTISMISSIAGGSAQGRLAWDMSQVKPEL